MSDADPEYEERPVIWWEISDILNYHLTMSPNEKGWVGCQCGEKYASSYNTHLTEKLYAFVSSARSS